MQKNEDNRFVDKTEKTSISNAEATLNSEHNNKIKLTVQKQVSNKRISRDQENYREWHIDHNRELIKGKVQMKRVASI